MKLKPRSSVHNARALLYRRYTDMEKSYSNNAAYKTADNKLWQFDTDKLMFIAYNGTSATTISIANNTYLKYGVKYASYSGLAWTYTNTPPATFSLAQFPNQQKYQLNQYYYVGTFDYMLKGGVESMDVQYIKGNIIPMRSFDIRYFNDELNIDHDDLIVIDDRLYMVESVSWDIKRMPKQFKVYFATLTSIL